MLNRTPVVTVFGGSGFIGRHLIRRLARSGAEIRIAVRHPVQAGFLKTAGAVGQIVPIAVDVRDAEQVARVVAGADAVVNLIGILHPQGPWTFEAAHADAADRIARSAKAAGTKAMVQMSALGADSGSESVYARTKAEGENLVRSAFPGATILRPSVVFGPEDQFLNRFARLAGIAPALPLIGGGTTRFQPVWVGDVAEAVTAALGDPAAAGRTYELGGPRTYSFADLLRLILRVIGKKRMLVTVPWAWAERLAAVAEAVPVGAPALSRDQVILLRRDNVVSGALPGLKELGISQPASIEVMAPLCLGRFVTPAPGDLTRRALG